MLKVNLILSLFFFNFYVFEKCKFILVVDWVFLIEMVPPKLSIISGNNLVRYPLSVDHYISCIRYPSEK